MRRKLKLAIFSYYSGSVSRGVETFVSEISRRLKTKVELTVYAKKPGPNQTLKQFSQASLKQLEADPPDILMPLNNGWMSWQSKCFCLRHKTKLVLAGFAGIGWIDRFNLWLFPDVFVCCTQAQARWARLTNPWAKLAMINLGVDTDKFKPEGKKLTLSLRPPIILCVAGPEPYKRVNLTIKAVSRLKNVSLLVIGQQPDSINQLAKQLLGKGYLNLTVSYQQLDQVYRAVDLFTLTSEPTEAYGIVILEALASGLPVVVNDDPIRRELVGQAGSLINPLNLAAYAEAIKTNLGKKNQPQFRQQALKFSWDKISQDYLDLWQSLAG